MPMTKILRVNPLNPEVEILNEAAAIIQNGGLVAFPTETVYGLGANALDPQAVERIFAAKGRPPTDPLIVHIANVGDLMDLAPDAPPVAYELAEQFWPGPLTLVVKRSGSIAPNVSGGLPTIGVRVPAHPVARMLIHTAHRPVAAPSANLFSHTSPTEALHVLEDLDGRVDLILDGGPCPIGVESTVLDLLHDPPVILRPGGVSLESLRTLLPTVRFHRGRALSANETARSPGMLDKHYAPHTPLQIISGPAQAVQDHLAALLRTASENQERIGLMLTDEMIDACAVCHSDHAVVVRLGPASNLEIVASRLFAALRSLDQAGVGQIYAIEPENVLVQHGLGPAVHDRLLRAASGNILYLPG